MRYQRPKGTADILPEESEKWHFVEETARLLFADYQYREIRTPLFENFEIFSRSAGDTSDVVTKEMYDFHDKGDRHVALRPEGTAGVVRAYVENKLYGPEHTKPYKAFYIGPMFRYERPQSGRQRQFHQIGVEAFGSDSPALDVEVIAMALAYFKQLGIDGLRVAVNSLGDTQSRADYRQALIDYLKPHYDELSADSQERLEKNPLRVLDSKEPEDQQFVADAPSILDYLTDEARSHFEQVKQLLDVLGIDYVVDPTMVRGLDYYNHTIFEVMVQSKALGHGYTTVCGGGRYSGLVKELGGPDDAGVGFAIGLERLMLLLADKGIEVPDGHQLDVYVVGIGDETNVETLKLVQAIRGFGFSANRDFLGRKPKAQFKSANKENASFVITIGQSELESRTAHFKSMVTSEEVSLPLDDLYTKFPEIYDKYIGE
ncbi:histidyl-tRNA synthetase [Paucilactobacillus vaccinostercus DSM 20634]|jgi:histidyl-tRNA synthetase|uniref:Histidine--tRNA ligase n=1 Tax=Paucilactobacillus vaccinostercus DSM 20634 TaxID=1423813 RepID=A0A0R2A7S3_9LACO|nr:histidine--tRNA ligase [Paucilactobacillus vaccinostercus]KRM62482.1 histidyl-tRNA synthetase [Paucilactobacillus vaccinostercus DSM 20634]